MAISLIPAASAVSGTLPAANLPTGSVLQVVQGSYGTQVTNASTTPADTNLTATITPKFSTSKILVLINQNAISTNVSGMGITFTLVRNSTTITTFAGYYMYGTANDQQDAAGCYLDSPATTSATTYKTQQVKTVANAGTVYSQSSGSATSTITLLEIAG